METKKYFAHYIPVKGKVEIGDAVLDYTYSHSGPKLGFVRKFGGYNEHNRTLDLEHGNTKWSVAVNDYTIHTPPYRKVKLFLCSREEVKKGDMVYSTIDNSVDTLFECIDPMMPYQVKVVGEISPDALSYVSEGQEFDDRDISLKVGDFVQQTSVEELYKYDREMHMSKADYVAIKGPCKHFH